MQARSALFDQTIAGAHTLLVRADVLAGGKVIASGLPVAGGSVTGDRSQFARRTCSVVIGDPTLIPTGSLSDPLSLSNEIRLWRGAVTPAGDELLPVGTFGIRSVQWDDGGAFTGITVTGIDRSKRLAESRFPYPRTSDPSIGAIDQIKTLIWEVLPGVTVTVDSRLRDVTLPQVTWQENRDQAITDMTTAIGAELFADPMGGFVLQPVPTLADPLTDTVASGAGGVLVSVQRNLTRDGVFNGVIARGQTTSTDLPAPVSQLIVDADRSSPTYWYGNFGQVVGFYESSLLVDIDQCNTAATALLHNQLGLARSINYGSVVNPAREPGDVVGVVNPVTGALERHLQQQVTIPLDAKGVMSAQTRSTLGTATVGPAVYGALS